MAFEAKNIIVGAAPLFLSKKDSTESSYATVLPEGANVTANTSIYDEEYWQELVEDVTHQEVSQDT